MARLTAPTGALGRVWQIPRPVVYRALGRLEAAELVTPKAIETGRGPQRQLFGSTESGRRDVSRWLETPVQHIRDVRSQLLIKLALLERRRTDATPLLRRQREVLAPIADAFRTSTGDGVVGFEAVLGAWRHANVRATLEFLDELTSWDSETAHGSRGRGGS